MEIIILAGNSLHNKSWAEELARNLEPIASCYVYQYKHWKTGEKTIDFEYEIKNLAKDLIEKEDYILVGKSAGSVAILEALTRKLVHPNKCVLMGLPFNFANQNGQDLMKSISASDVRREFIQNKNDPYGSAESVKKMLESLKIKNYSFTETEGNTHDYLDYEKIIELIKD
jgi:predicted alpha/beta hydrolase family esterase